MDKTTLRQALKFRNENPTYSQVEKLCKSANSYQIENDVYFLRAKYQGRVEILNLQRFFEFISDVALDNGVISCFDDIEKILSAETRQENIKSTGDSKNSIVRVFDRVIVFQKSDGDPILCKESGKIKINTPILAVENGETFLNIYSAMSKYGFDNYVYIGGFGNSITREFLKDKEVVFYLDYDIEAIRIYDSFECRHKSFFKHPDLENYFRDDKKKKNKELYLKQRHALPSQHPELQWLIDLITTYNRVVEQEAFE